MWFYSGTPSCKHRYQLVGQSSFDWCLVGLLLCCMALCASEMYRLTVDELCQVCADRGLDSRGPVRMLQQRLAEYVKGNKMELLGDEKMAQASVQTNLERNVDPPVFQNVGCCSHGGSGDC